MNGKKKKIIIFVTIFLLLISTIVVSTIAYLNKINKKQNDFVIGTIVPQILQDYNEIDNSRENIRIKNVGNSPIYIRATILYYFQNSDGQIIDGVPVQNADYSLIFSSSENWVKGSDGYYYYKSIINPEEITDNLIDRCLDLNNDINKLFMVDVTVQAIQATPISAVKEAWNVNVVDKEISVL